VDFKRFRAENADGLDALKHQMRSWYAILDKIIAAGEAGLAPQS
jgi:hypothetical protein